MFRIYFNFYDKAIQTDSTLANAETLEDAENLALCECRLRFGTNMVFLHYIGGMLYDVLKDFTDVGTVSIVSL